MTITFTEFREIRGTAQVLQVHCGHQPFAVLQGFFEGGNGGAHKRNSSHALCIVSLTSFDRVHQTTKTIIPLCDAPDPLVTAIACDGSHVAVVSKTDNVLHVFGININNSKSVLKYKSKLLAEVALKGIVRLNNDASAEVVLLGSEDQKVKWFSVDSQGTAKVNKLDLTDGEKLFSFDACFSFAKDDGKLFLHNAEQPGFLSARDSFACHVTNNGVVTTFAAISESPSSSGSFCTLIDLQRENQKAQRWGKGDIFPCPFEGEITSVVLANETHAVVTISEFPYVYLLNLRTKTAAVVPVLCEDDVGCDVFVHTTGDMMALICSNLERQLTSIFSMDGSPSREKCVERLVVSNALQYVRESGCVDVVTTDGVNGEELQSRTLGALSPMAPISLWISMLNKLSDLSANQVSELAKDKVFQLDEFGADFSSIQLVMDFVSGDFKSRTERYLKRQEQLYDPNVTLRKLCTYSVLQEVVWLLQAVEKLNTIPEIEQYCRPHLTKVLKDVARVNPHYVLQMISKELKSPDSSSLPPQVITESLVQIETLDEPACRLLFDGSLLKKLPADVVSYVLASQQLAKVHNLYVGPACFYEIDAHQRSDVLWRILCSQLEPDANIQDLTTDLQTQLGVPQYVMSWSLFIKELLRHDKVNVLAEVMNTEKCVPVSERGKAVVVAVKDLICEYKSSAGTQSKVQQILLDITKVKSCSDAHVLAQTGFDVLCLIEIAERILKRPLHVSVHSLITDQSYMEEVVGAVWELLRVEGCEDEEFKDKAVLGDQLVGILRVAFHADAAARLVLLSRYSLNVLESIAERHLIKYSKLTNQFSRFLLDVIKQNQAIPQPALQHYFWKSVEPEIALLFARYQSLLSSASPDNQRARDLIQRKQNISFYSHIANILSGEKQARQHLQGQYFHDAAVLSLDITHKSEELLRSLFVSQESQLFNDIQSLKASGSVLIQFETMVDNMYETELNKRGELYVRERKERQSMEFEYREATSKLLEFIQQQQKTRSFYEKEEGRDFSGLLLLHQTVVDRQMTSSIAMKERNLLRFAYDKGTVLLTETQERNNLFKLEGEMRVTTRKTFISTVPTVVTLPARLSQQLLSEEDLGREKLDSSSLGIFNLLKIWFATRSEIIKWEGKERSPLRTQYIMATCQTTEDTMRDEIICEETKVYGKMFSAWVAKRPAVTTLTGPILSTLTRQEEEGRGNLEEEEEEPRMRLAAQATAAKARIPRVASPQASNRVVAPPVTPPVTVPTTPSTPPVTTT
eukprot:PhF_6_TR27920/c1_g1_i1/m.41045